MRAPSDKKTSRKGSKFTRCSINSWSRRKAGWRFIHSSWAKANEVKLSERQKDSTWVDMRLYMCISRHTHNIYIYIYIYSYLFVYITHTHIHMQIDAYSFFVHVCVSLSLPTCISQFKMNTSITRAQHLAAWSCTLWSFSPGGSWPQRSFQDKEAKKTPLCKAPWKVADPIKI